MRHSRLNGKLNSRFVRPAYLHCWIVLVLILGGTVTSGRSAETDPKPTPAPDEFGRSTAVALNYCRASFHRIKRSSSKRVLIEEQEKILNNLNLNRIADEEVVRLYTGVLDEISQIQIAEKDRKLVRQSNNRSIVPQLAATAFQAGTELATAQYGAAVRTGVRSWWDYRSMVFNRKIDVWQIEKKRMGDIVGKSSLFLDTFWKLARKRHIPDRWLIRDSDLDKLDVAMREQDLEVRLRVLRRMEHFMQCYPPYWYYVGRTQQALGQFFAASETYGRLLEIGDGHFRKDEMLAAGLANRAVIQEFLNQPGAVKTAETALAYSTEAWEVNLMCAHVLEKHNRLDAAEDAILRNLDVDLERRQSSTCLLSLYLHSKNIEKLARALDDPLLVRFASEGVLLQSAAMLGPQKTPPVVTAALVGSLAGGFDLHFGPDDFVIRVLGNWNFHRATLSLERGGHSFKAPLLRRRKGHFEIRFRRIVDIGNPINTTAHRTPVVLVVQFAAAPKIRLVLQKRPSSPMSGGPPIKGIDSTGPLASLLPNRRSEYRLVAATLGETFVPLQAGIRAPQPVPVTTIQPAPALSGPASSVPITSEKPKSHPPRPVTVDQPDNTPDQTPPPPEDFGSGPKQ